MATKFPLKNDKVSEFAISAHSANQPTQSDKPVGPEPKSTTASRVDGSKLSGS